MSAQQQLLLAQTFTSPSTAMYIAAITIGGFSSGDPIQYDIFETDGTTFNFDGGSLFRANFPSMDNVPVTFHPGLLLTPNTLYAIGISNDVSNGAGFSVTDDFFSGGVAYVLNGPIGHQTFLPAPGNQDAIAFAVTFSATDPGTGGPVIGPTDPGSTTATPEPASLVLTGTGIAGLAAVARKRRRAA